MRSDLSSTWSFHRYEDKWLQRSRGSSRILGNLCSWCCIGLGVSNIGCQKPLVHKAMSYVCLCACIHALINTTLLNLLMLQHACALVSRFLYVMPFPNPACTFFLPKFPTNNRQLTSIPTYHNAAKSEVYCESYFTLWSVWVCNSMSTCCYVHVCICMYLCTSVLYVCQCVYVCACFHYIIV